MPLVDESEEDRKLAALIKYKSVENYDERQAKKRKAIEDASVRNGDTRAHLRLLHKQYR